MTHCFWGKFQTNFQFKFLREPHQPLRSPIEPICYRIPQFHTLPWQAGVTRRFAASLLDALRRLGKHEMEINFIQIFGGGVAVAVCTFRRAGSSFPARRRKIEITNNADHLPWGECLLWCVFGAKLSF